MTRKNIPNARSRILQAAVKIFARKSFEGSRIEEIAQEASVPKSLIYYHFKSKEDMFEVLIQGFINEYTELIHASEEDTHAKKAQDIPDRLNSIYDFAQKNSDLVRIMLIDSLKKSEEKPVIYKIVEALAEKEQKQSGLRSAGNYDRDERLVAEFFTSIIPNCAYLCFCDSWTKYFGIEKEAFDELFLKVITSTHGAYHKYHE